jgi:hypothetical protein
MKWIVSLLVVALVAGALWASSSQTTQAPEEEEIEDFVPTEKVPAHSSVSFPVDI